MYVFIYIYIFIHIQYVYVCIYIYIYIDNYVHMFARYCMYKCISHFNISFNLSRLYPIHGSWANPRRCEGIVLRCLSMVASFDRQSTRGWDFFKPKADYLADDLPDHYVNHSFFEESTAGFPVAWYVQILAMDWRPSHWQLVISENGSHDETP